MKSMLVANMVDNELVEKNREVGDEAVAGDVYDDNKPFQQRLCIIAKCTSTGNLNGRKYETARNLLCLMKLGVFLKKDLFTGAERF